MAEGAPLLREYVGKTCIEGSNPSDSAKAQTTRALAARSCFLRAPINAKHCREGATIVAVPISARAAVEASTVADMSELRSV